MNKTNNNSSVSCSHSEYVVGEEVRVQIFKDMFTCRGTIAYDNGNGTYEILFDDSKRAKLKRKLLKYRFKYTNPTNKIITQYPLQEGVFTEADLSPLLEAEKEELASSAVTQTGSEMIAMVECLKSLGNSLFIANDFIGAIDYYERGMELLQTIGRGSGVAAGTGVEFSIGSPVIVRRKCSDAATMVSSSTSGNNSTSTGNSNDYEYRCGIVSDVLSPTKKTSCTCYEILLSPPRQGIGPGTIDQYNDSDVEEQEETIIIRGDDHDAITMGLFKITTEKAVSKYDAAVAATLDSDNNTSQNNNMNNVGSKSTLSVALLGKSGGNEQLMNLQRALLLNTSKCLWKMNGYVGWACHYASLAVCMTIYIYEDYSNDELYVHGSKLFQQYEKQLVDVYYIKAKTLLSAHRAGLAKAEVGRMRELFMENPLATPKSTTGSNPSSGGSYSQQKISQLLTEIDQFNNRKRRENKVLAKHIASWVGTAMDINAKQQGDGQGAGEPQIEPPSAATEEDDEDDEDDVSPFLW